MLDFIVSAFAIVGLVIVVGMALVVYIQNRRFLADSRQYENALSRRREIEDALRKTHPHVLVLPAWDVYHEDKVYTVTEDLGETPEQVARRILDDLNSGHARSRVAPSHSGSRGAP